MSIMTLCKVDVFSRGKESYESILILVLLRKITYYNIILQYVIICNI